MNIQCFGPLSEDAICKLESALGVHWADNRCGCILRVWRDAEFGYSVLE